jgi:PTH1 family peptidyl-tRNA hydrolase
MKIVVGLGNPGPDYASTRHNVGFDVVSEVARVLGWVSNPSDFDRLARTKFDGLALDGVLTTGSGSEKLLLLKPMTYMNDSGRSVLAAAQFYQCAISDLLIILDDLALPCGTLRIRGDGSSGGHNGLKDIERVLSSNAYPRLRVGIDAPPPKVPARSYVLERFSAEQLPIIRPALSRAASAVLTWAEKGLTTAMNQFNTSIPSDPGTPGPSKQSQKPSAAPGVPGRKPCGDLAPEAGKT